MSQQNEPKPTSASVRGLQETRKPGSSAAVKPLPRSPGGDKPSPTVSKSPFAAAQSDVVPPARERAPSVPRVSGAHFPRAKIAAETQPFSFAVAPITQSETGLNGPPSGLSPTHAPAEQLLPVEPEAAPQLPSIAIETSASPAMTSAPRWMLPTLAVTGLALGIAAALPIAVFLHRSRSSASALAPTALPTAAPTASAVISGPAPHEGLGISCKVVNGPRRVAPKAILAAGVEARIFGDDVALGFATTSNDGAVIRLDGSSLATLSVVTARSKLPVRRVSPVITAGGAIGISVDVDRRGDPIRGRRTILGDPPRQVGTSGGNLVMASASGAPNISKLWPLTGQGEIDSARAAEDQDGDQSLVALIFRRKSTVGLGLLRGGSPSGSITYFKGIGSMVGAPTVALDHATLMAAWAERGPTSEPFWGLRVVRSKLGEPAEEPHDFPLPGAGQATSAPFPSLVSVPGNGFLLIWAQGPASARTVRGVALTTAGGATGSTIDLSEIGRNAALPQAAMGSSGRGVAAFFQSTPTGYELAATTIECGI